MATILPTSIFINPGYKFTAFCKTIVMPLNMMNNNFENICDRLALHPELRQHILLLHSIPFHTSIDITLICICLHNISRLCFQNCYFQYHHLISSLCRPLADLCGCFVPVLLLHLWEQASFGAVWDFLLHAKGTNKDHRNLNKATQEKLKLKEKTP